MASIRQNVFPDVLPDFRNLGVIARVLVAVNALVLAGALFAAPEFPQALDRFVQAAAFFEPLLLLEVACFAALSPWSARAPYWAGCIAVTLLAMLIAGAYHAALIAAGADVPAQIARTVLICALFTSGLLAYFRLLTKAFSPAIAEARLQALQARIRPHFLFNSLNAVLALIRGDPRRAERTLEDLADLFRALMSDGRSLVRLADEISLIERYAAIEQLRLGERLRMSWELDEAPVDAMLPPLVLQPLLENAIYHGVEPGTGIGDVRVRIERRGDRVHVQIENPSHAAAGKGAGSVRAGNHMALDNIRERLMLFFDAEAKLQTRDEKGRYRVEIDIPYRSRA